MLVVSKDFRIVINMENITDIYIGADDVSIKADFSNGKGCQISRYPSKEMALEAMRLLTKSADIGKSIFCMPQDKEVEAIIQRDSVQTHHISGKKVKGHGGS